MNQSVQQLITFQIMFKNRNLVIATKHRKEVVMMPLLSKALDVTCITIPDFDTDIFGTFTGEVKRDKDPFHALRQKCLKAMEISKCDLGIASEGSFGMHPSYFFTAADDELVIFIDKKNQLEIIARELSTETNFKGAEVKTEAELIEFAKQALFPTHGLILRKSKDNTTDILKDFDNLSELLQAFHKMMREFQTVFVETDMRAMNNPSRLLVIERATQKLIEKIQSNCPACETPGFSITTYKSGLLCSLCGSPTESTLSYVSECQRCQHTSELKYPNNKTKEDPMYCQKCNP